MTAQAEGEHKHPTSVIFTISAQEGMGKLDSALPLVNQFIYVYSDAYVKKIG